MLSNAERGKAFQIVCAKALRRALGRDFDLEVPIAIGPGKPHFFDLATRERKIIVECKAFGFMASGNTPSAKLTTAKPQGICGRCQETRCASSSSNAHRATPG